MNSWSQIMQMLLTENFSNKYILTDRKMPLVAGSVGPYGAFLHDGSEYTGAYESWMSVEVSQRQKTYAAQNSSYQTVASASAPLYFRS